MTQRHEISINGARYVDVTRYTQDGIAYICAGDADTSDREARRAATTALRTGESLADDMERVDGCCTWSVRLTR